MGRFLNTVRCSLELLFLVAAFAQSTKADSLTITYTVNQNQRCKPFDPSLPYPGNVGIALEAINPMTGSIFTENDASIHVVTATPEPSAIVLLLSAFGGLLFAGMMPSKLKFTGASR